MVNTVSVIERETEKERDRQTGRQTDKLSNRHFPILQEIYRLLSFLRESHSPIYIIIATVIRQDKIR